MSGAKGGSRRPNLTTTERLALPLLNGTVVYDTDIGADYHVLG